MFSPGGYNRGLHGRPQARTLTATIVQRLVDECPMSAMELALERCRLNVRITPGSGRRADIGGRQRSAMCGRLRVGKENLHGASLVGAAMCSAC